MYQMRNSALPCLFTCLLISTIAMPGTGHAAELQIERLTWAGVKLVSENTTVFIDAVGKDLWDGNAPEGLVPVTADTDRRYALVSHVHNDHFDVDTLREVLGERGYVICHESVATYIASRGLKVIPAKTYSPVSRGGFLFTAVPAEDGLGAEQVSWVISVDDKRFLHAGDTLWHGQWPLIGSQFGPFDAVFLPINGARVLRDPMPETPAVMSPPQAVDAAILLRAKVLIPIHYGLNDPPYYQEVDGPIDALAETAERRDVRIRNLLPGETLTLDD
jgi:L-ascorbate metabolism protein UlaG (beta-lactamase superfamily)